MPGPSTARRVPAVIGRWSDLVDKGRAAWARGVSLLVQQLKQGATPTRLSWSLAVGVVVGCFPVFGMTTVLGVAAGVALRLNHVAIQVGNYAAGPLQFAFMVPLMELGDLVAGTDSLPLSATALREQFRADAVEFLRLSWTSVWHACLAWAVLAGPATGVLGVVLRPVVGHLAARWARPATPEPRD